MTKGKNKFGHRDFLQTAKVATTTVPLWLSQLNDFKLGLTQQSTITPKIQNKSSSYTYNHFSNTFGIEENNYKQLLSEALSQELCRSLFST